MTGVTAMPDAPMMAVFVMLCLLGAGAVVVGGIALAAWLLEGDAHEGSYHHRGNHCCDRRAG